MGIKSFQGARKYQSTVAEAVPLKVSDYMTRDLIVFRTNEPIETVMETLVKYRISGAPVVNDDNHLVGMISESDCVKQISESRYYNMPIQDRTIEKYMATDIDTIDGNMDIFDAANKFVREKRRRFPIVENGKLVGQISQKDVLKAAMQFKGQTWK